jgi:putative Mg2+ transporter-C (MgtC) family protein
MLRFVTVIGLCFGGGQIAFGIAGLALGMLVLTGLRRFDYHIQDFRARTPSRDAAPGPAMKSVSNPPR